jgi:VCBS repeat-containing protein
MNISRLSPSTSRKAVAPILALALGLTMPVAAQAANCVSGRAIDASTTCDIPAGSVLTLEAWGGGGGGGQGDSGGLGFLNATGGGGGGGAYCKNTFTLTALTTLTVTIGAGGSNGIGGNPTLVTGTGITAFGAGAGYGGQNSANGGLGGTNTVFTCTLASWNGGAGGNGMGLSADYFGGGGGGGSAFTTGAGFSGTNGGVSVAGTGGLGTGQGGNGASQSPAFSAQQGAAPGAGGGGGSGTSTAATGLGATGANGRVIITYALANTAPTFVSAGVASLSVAQAASATDITGLLHVSDADSSQTETWSQSAAPSHGTLSFVSATASTGAGSADIAPGGTITYTPTASYVGVDSFTVQVTDGTAVATRTIRVTVGAPKPVVLVPVLMLLLD